GAASVRLGFPPRFAASWPGPGPMLPGPWAWGAPPPPPAANAGRVARPSAVAAAAAPEPFRNSRREGAFGRSVVLGLFMLGDPPRRVRTNRRTPAHRSGCAILTPIVGGPRGDLKDFVCISSAEKPDVGWVESSSPADAAGARWRASPACVTPPH